jgi:hypothetical protein
MKMDGSGEMQDILMEQSARNLMSTLDSQMPLQLLEEIEERRTGSNLSSFRTSYRP